MDGPDGPPRALQASECHELLDPTRASCLILAQRQPGKFISACGILLLRRSHKTETLPWLIPPPKKGHTPTQKLQENPQDSLDGNRSSFQLANSTPPQGVIDCAIAPSARMANVSPSTATVRRAQQRRNFNYAWKRAWTLQKFCIRIPAPLSRQPLVKGERLVRSEMSAAITKAKVLEVP